MAADSKRVWGAFLLWGGAFLGNPLSPPYINISIFQISVFSHITEKAIQGTIA
jgi:hypothetical protein